MNDPNKAISVNLSSLLSLKAELLRKQAEVSKAKATRVPAESYIPNKNGVGKKIEKDNEQKVVNSDFICEYEDSALLEKSQKVLEAKSKYYDRMTRCKDFNADANCLVQFHRKQENGDEVPTSPDRNGQSSEHASTGSDTDDDDDDNWVEYIDCLGRTRKCLRKDLEKMKKQDKELAASMPERLDQSKFNWMLDKAEDSTTTIGPEPPESVMSEGLSIISKQDEMRADWEKKQEENLDKPNVHYQDVFFNEARQHGVGYYAFSTDEAVRAKQQHELEEARKQTISEQEQRDKLRAQREKIIAERVRAAKNRQRARLGLPPLEDDVDEQKAKESIEKEETKEERRERKRLEKLQRKQEKLTAAQELERKHHIRPWDKEKLAIDATADAEDEVLPIEWHYKPERLPMSQAEWNEQKRTERNPEFAPPMAHPASSQSAEYLRTNFKSDAAPYFKAPSAAEFEKYQSCNTSKRFQRRNYIIDESLAAQKKIEEDEEEEKRMWSRGAAIPPPAELDVCHSTQAKKSKSSTELERSIEAGLRFLRNNCDKNTLSMKSSWTSKADY